MLAFLRRRFRRPKLVRIEGACRMTGNCCRNLILVDRGRPVRTERQLRRLRRRQPEYKMFQPHGAPPAEGHWRFRCRNLGPDNRCQIYQSRPEICRRYPSPELFRRGGSLLPGCGYRVVHDPPKGEAFEQLLGRKLQDLDV